MAFAIALWRCRRPLGATACWHRTGWHLTASATDGSPPLIAKCQPAYRGGSRASPPHSAPALDTMWAEALRYRPSGEYSVICASSNGLNPKCM